MRPLPENPIKKYEHGYPCMIDNVVGRIIGESDKGSWGYINGIHAFSIVHFGTPHGSIIETGVAYLAEITEEGMQKLMEFEKDASKKEEEQGIKPYIGKWKILQPIVGKAYENVFKDYPLTQKSYMVGVHRYAYEAGKPAEILGLKWVKPEGLDWRIAFELEHFNGKKDFVPYDEVVAGLYKIISDVDLIEGRIPPVTE